MLVANIIAGKITEALKSMLQKNLLVPASEHHMNANRECRLPPLVFPMTRSHNQRLQPAAQTEITDMDATGSAENLKEECRYIDSKMDNIHGPPHDKNLGPSTEVPS